MTQGETLISLILIVIAYFLYHIAKQLSYLTGKRIKLSFFSWRHKLPQKQKRTQRTESHEKLTN